MTGEPRVISAKRTAFYKFVMPLLTVGVAIGIVTVALRASTSSTPLFAKVVVGGLIVAYLLGARRYADLKCVALLDDALAVSNFQREIVVPLRDVVRVREMTSRSWRTSDVIVAIDLARDTDFGRRVTFLTPPTFASSEAPHPIVEELRDAVTAAKR